MIQIQKKIVKKYVFFTVQLSKNTSYLQKLSDILKAYLVLRATYGHGGLVEMTTAFIRVRFSSVACKRTIVLRISTRGTDIAHYKTQPFKKETVKDLFFLFRQKAVPVFARRTLPFQVSKRFGYKPMIAECQYFVFQFC